MPLLPRTGKSAHSLRRLVQFIDKDDDPFGRFKRAQSIRQMNQDTRKRNRARLDANVAAGGRLGFLTRASQNS